MKLQHLNNIQLHVSRRLGEHTLVEHAVACLRSRWYISAITRGTVAQESYRVDYTRTFVHTIKAHKTYDRLIRSCCLLLAFCKTLYEGGFAYTILLVGCQFD